MNIGDKFVCLKDIQISENHLFKSKYMILKIISIENRNGSTYARVTNDSDIYEIILSLLLNKSYFKLVA